MPENAAAQDVAVEVKQDVPRWTALDLAIFACVMDRENVADPVEAAIGRSVDHHHINITKEVVTMQTAYIRVDGEQRVGLMLGRWDAKLLNFTWASPKTRQLQKEHLAKYAAAPDCFTPAIMKSLNKLFDTDVVALDAKYAKLLPYLMAVLNRAFNVIRFETEAPLNYVQLYFLIKSYVPCNLDFDGFVANVRQVAEA